MEDIFTYIISVDILLINNAYTIYEIAYHPDNGGSNYISNLLNPTVKTVI